MSWAVLRRSAFYAVLGAALAVIAGTLVANAVGLYCACWWSNPKVGLLSGAIGGAFFAHIYQPRLFEQRQDEP